MTLLHGAQGQHPVTAEPVERNLQEGRGLHSSTLQLNLSRF